MELTGEGAARFILSHPSLCHVNRITALTPLPGCLTRTPPQAILENNVVYDIMGHAFFLEDGIETGNIFDGNLGFLTRASQVTRMPK